MLRKAECALRDNPAPGRWLRQQPSGRLVIDRTKVAAEQRLNGKHLLSTSDPDLSDKDIALGYENLLEAERGFREVAYVSVGARHPTIQHPPTNRLPHQLHAESTTMPTHRLDPTSSQLDRDAQRPGG